MIVQGHTLRIEGQFIQRRDITMDLQVEDQEEELEDLIQDTALSLKNTVIQEVIQHGSTKDHQDKIDKDSLKEGEVHPMIPSMAHQTNVVLSQAHLAASEEDTASEDISSKADTDHHNSIQLREDHLSRSTLKGMTDLGTMLATSSSEWTRCVTSPLRTCTTVPTTRSRGRGWKGKEST